MSRLAVNTELLRKVLVGFVREEIHKVGVRKAVLGLSGGIDSALVAFLAAEALGPENVHAIIMPYRTSVSVSSRGRTVRRRGIFVLFACSGFTLTVPS